MSLPKDGGLDTTPPAVAALTPSQEPCPAGADVPREGSREIQKRGKVISVPHDWCKSTDSPVPYKIWCWQADAGNLANSVRQTDCRSHVQGSYVKVCYGDEPGKGGGIKSSTCQAECTLIGGSPTVRAEGRPMGRRFDKWEMNHGNTWGCLENPEDTGNYAAPKAKLIDAKMELKQQFGQLPADADSYQALYSPLHDPVSPTPPGDPKVTTPTGNPQTTPTGDPIDRDALAKSATRRLLMNPAGALAVPILLLTTSTLNKGEHDVRVTRVPDCDCITGPYSKIKDQCKIHCGASAQAHHIVPDYTLRCGNRSEGEAGIKRISGLPNFQDGPSICLIGQKSDAGSEHGLAHEADAAVESLGSGENFPRGTADIATITMISVNAAIIATKGVCAAQIAKAVKAQPNLSSSILGRTTIQPPAVGQTHTVRYLLGRELRFTKLKKATKCSNMNVLERRH